MWFYLSQNEYRFEIHINTLSEKYILYWCTYSVLCGLTIYINLFVWICGMYGTINKHLSWKGRVSEAAGRGWIGTILSRGENKLTQTLARRTKMADSFRQRRASEAAGRDGVGWRNARGGPLVLVWKRTNWFVWNARKLVHIRDWVDWICNSVMPEPEPVTVGSGCSWQVGNI